jgi:hypothetical protein
MGYSLRHKCYKCLPIPTGRICFSCDVIFQEDLFPFADKAHASSKSLASKPSTSPIHFPLSHICPVVSPTFSHPREVVSQLLHHESPLRVPTQTTSLQPLHMTILLPPHRPSPAAYVNFNLFYITKTYFLLVYIITFKTILQSII